MLGSQFHPEFTSRPNRPHPLFKQLIQAAIAYRDSHVPDDAPASGGAEDSR